jgi:hypothetical protein
VAWEISGTSKITIEASAVRVDDHIHNRHGFSSGPTSAYGFMFRVKTALENNRQGLQWFGCCRRHPETEWSLKAGCEKLAFP